MAKSTNIQLELTTENTVLFKDWRECVNGQGTDGNKSNMEIIDTHIGDLATAVGSLTQGVADVELAVESVKGKSGEIILYMANWVDNVYTLELPKLGISDAVFFAPITSADKTAMESANVIAQANAGSVTFLALTSPERDIKLSYFIAKGGGE